MPKKKTLLEGTESKPYSKFIVPSMAFLALLVFVLYLAKLLLGSGAAAEERFLLKGKEADEPSTWVTKSKPKKVILLIGDGMGLSQITAGMIAKRSSLSLERMVHIGLVKTHSLKLITDSAASATAIATGKKTYNGAISVNKKGEELSTIVELAKASGWAAALLTTVMVTHATPAAFFGHQKGRRGVNRALAEHFLTTGIEMLMGGGLSYFEAGYDDSPRDLLSEAHGLGYTVCTDIEKVEGNPAKILCLMSPTLPGRLKKRGNFLPLATQKALESLDANYERFFMMIEGGQIDLGGHANNSDYIIEEMLDFDRSIEKALNYAERDGQTLVLVTADHETGGYSITGGNMEKGEIEAKFSTDYHTGTLVPIFAYGPGAESFTGTFDNTEIFYKLRYLMGLD